MTKKEIYYFIIRWTAKPIYDYILKPIAFVFKSIGSIIKYLFSTFSGLVIIAALLYILWRLFIPQWELLSDVVVISIGVILVMLSLVWLVAFALGLLYSTEALRNEPNFISYIVYSMKKGLCQFKKDVVKSSKEHKEIRAKFKEEKKKRREAAIAKKLAEIAEEERKNNVIRSRSEILDIQG
jgi:hypothetical protein